VVIRREFERVNSKLATVNNGFEPSGMSPIDAMLEMYESLDARLQQHPTITRSVEAVKSCHAKSIQDLARKHTSTYKAHYWNLSVLSRGLVCRLLRVPRPRWFSSYYPLMSEVAWARYAACFVSKSKFDQRGGVWLSRNQPTWYQRICELGCTWWLKHKGLDGFAYASRPGLIVANLLFANADTVSYTQMPVLPFAMRSRSMRADFEVQLLREKSGVARAGVGAKYFVEVWGWTSAREDSSYINKYLELRPQVKALRRVPAKVERYPSLAGLAFRLRTPSPPHRPATAGPRVSHR
jgi:hypothetical protein